MVFLPHFEQNSVRLFCSKRYFFVYLQQNKRKDYGTENYRKKAGDCLIREKVVTFRMVKLNMLLSIFLITK